MVQMMTSGHSKHRNILDKMFNNGNYHHPSLASLPKFAEHYLAQSRIAQARSEETPHSGINCIRSSSSHATGHFLAPQIPLDESEVVVYNKDNKPFTSEYKSQMKEWEEKEGGEKESRKDYLTSLFQNNPEFLHLSIPDSSDHSDEEEVEVEVDDESLQSNTEAPVIDEELEMFRSLVPNAKPVVTIPGTSTLVDLTKTGDGNNQDKPPAESSNDQRKEPPEVRLAQSQKAQAKPNDHAMDTVTGGEKRPADSVEKSSPAKKITRSDTSKDKSGRRGGGRGGRGGRVRGRGRGRGRK